MRWTGFARLEYGGLFAVGANQTVFGKERRGICVTREQREQRRNSMTVWLMMRNHLLSHLDPSAPAILPRKLNLALALAKLANHPTKEETPPPFVVMQMGGGDAW